MARFESWNRVNCTLRMLDLQNPPKEDLLVLSTLFCISVFSNFRPASLIQLLKGTFLPKQRHMLPAYV